MRLIQVVCVMLVAGCSACYADLRWPEGARFRVETRGELQRPVDNWHYIVDYSMRAWSAQLGDACPFPFELADDGEFVITLIARAEWPYGEEYGGWQDTTKIDVLDMRTEGAVLAVLSHEFGHAFGLTHAPKGSGDVMVFGRESNFPTENDGRRARDELGCD